MTAFLKFLHIATIAIWAGGLIVLPFLFWPRTAIATGHELDRLHRVTRFVYVATASPAAFLAIGSGTALIFLEATFQEWFSLKMLFVGGLVMLHVVAGLVAVRIFEPEGHFGRVACSTLTGGYLLRITATLWVVLAKPDIDANQLATRLFAPGALPQLLGETRIPMP